MEFTLRVWRQAGPAAAGGFVDYPAPDISPDASFLEMLDVINERLSERGDDPIAFSHDCREGICGSSTVVTRSRSSRGGRSRFR